MNLESYQWKRRLLVVNNSVRQEFLLQKKFFESDPAGTKDRDLILIPVTEGNSSLWKKFRFQQGEFKMLLIGKDGAIKKKYLKATSLKSIYEVIDSMPMRQREMKRGSH